MLPQDFCFNSVIENTGMEALDWGLEERVGNKDSLTLSRFKRLSTCCKSIFYVYYVYYFLISTFKIKYGLSPRGQHLMSRLKERV